MTKLEFMHKISEEREHYKRIKTMLESNDFELLTCYTNISSYYDDTCFRALKFQTSKNISSWLLEEIWNNKCKNKSDCFEKIEETITFQGYYCYKNTVELINFLEKQGVKFDEDKYLSKLNQIKELLNNE